MQTKKMNLANIQGKLSRSEMKNIMAGSGGGCDKPTCEAKSNSTRLCVCHVSQCVCVDK